jgi:uncharacterized protein YndB with AHSA1/START domain
MTNEIAPAVHSTFRLERRYQASPARVFHAFADEASKRRWLVEGEGFKVFSHDADFRIGGREVSRFAYMGGPEMINETFYLDIIENARIVFSYRMALGGVPMSASLTTMELIPSGDGTLLVHTEQGVYLDGSDDGTGREEGTRQLLEILAKEVEG